MITDKPTNQTIVSSKSFEPLHYKSADGFTWLMWGFATFLILSVALFASDEAGLNRNGLDILLGIFVAANIINSVAAYLLLRSFWNYLANMFQKVVVASGAAVVAAFAVSSTLDLAGYLLSGIGISVSRATSYLLINDEFVLVVWWLLLPLQFIVFFVFGTMALILRYKRNKTGLHAPPPKRLIKAFYIFMVLAALAVGLMFFVMFEVV